jgi:capsular exopolysaccharide synthesis family protein
VILYTVVVFFVLAVLLCIFMKPRYIATATIQIGKEGTPPLGLDSISGQGGAPMDAMDYSTTLETQADILNSNALALKTINDLGLEHTYDYIPRFNPLAWALSLIGPKGVADTKNAPLADAPQRRDRALKIFAKHLKVKIEDGTRLIDISYSDPDPKISSAVVNHLVEAYQEYSYQIKFAATSQASSWLNNQLANLKRTAEDSQAKVAKLQEDAEVFSTGDVDASGRVASNSVVLSRLQDLNTALSAAEANRIVKQAIYLSVKNGGADAISGLAGNMNGASPEVINSMTVLQGLRMQEDTLKATYSQDQVKYGPQYPLMQQMRSQLEQLHKSIEDEVQRLETRAKNDYDTAVVTEADTRDLYLKQKAEANGLNSKAIDYTVAKQEAEQNRNLYQSLFGKVQEAGALEGLKASTISIVDPGMVPGKPKVPNVPIYLALSIFAGFFIGCALALTLDRIDQRVQNIDQIESQLGIAPLVILPSMTGGKNAEDRSKGLKLPTLGDLGKGHPAHSLSLADAASVEALTMPGSPYIEGLRVLRTTILHSVDVAPPRVILVTGSQTGDGTTSLGLNLTILLAEQGHKALFVECNMRRPAIQQMLGLNPSEGLSSILAGSQIKNGIVGIPQVPGGFVLPCGTPPPNPADLLGSANMRSLVSQWREHFDFIILDTPPVLAVADSMTLLNVSDLVLLLVRHEHTPLKAVLQSYRLLASAARHKLFGVVVNDVSPDSGALQDHYGYQESPYVDGFQEVSQTSSIVRVSEAARKS